MCVDQQSRLLWCILDQDQSKPLRAHQDLPCSVHRDVFEPCHLHPLVSILSQLQGTAVLDQQVEQDLIVHLKVGTGHLQATASVRV